MWQWALLPNVIFACIHDFLTTRFRLLVMERCCRKWRLQSLAGWGWSHNVDLLSGATESFHLRFVQDKHRLVKVLGIWELHPSMCQTWPKVEHLHLITQLDWQCILSLPKLRSLTLWLNQGRCLHDFDWPTSIIPSSAPNLDTIVSISKPSFSIEKPSCEDCPLALIPPPPLTCASDSTLALDLYEQLIRKMIPVPFVCDLTIPAFPNLSTLILSPRSNLKTKHVFSTLSYISLKSTTSPEQPPPPHILNLISLNLNSPILFPPRKYLFKWTTYSGVIQKFFTARSGSFGFPMLMWLINNFGLVVNHYTYWSLATSLSFEGALPMLQYLRSLDVPFDPDQNCEGGHLNQIIATCTDFRNLEWIVAHGGEPFRVTQPCTLQGTDSSFNTDSPFQERDQVWSASLHIGSKVVADDKGVWRNAVVINVNQTSLRVHYIGWENAWDEWIYLKANRLRPRAGSKVLADDKGVWRNAVVLSGLQTSLRVHYIGWDKAWDEWIDLQTNRLRARAVDNRDGSMLMVNPDYITVLPLLRCQCLGDEGTNEGLSHTPYQKALHMDMSQKVVKTKSLAEAMIRGRKNG